MSDPQTVNKCPACGSLRTTFTAFCPDCGYEFAEVKVADSMERFSEKLNELEFKLSNRYDYRESHGLTFWSVVGWIFLFPIMFCIFLVKRVQAKNGSIEGAARVKAEMISTYPVPNSRNDLLEFALLVENKVMPVNYVNAVSDAAIDTQKWNSIWLKKGEQIKTKAEIALKDDRQTLNRIYELYDKASEKYRENENIQWTALGVLFVVFIFFMILVW